MALREAGGFHAGAVQGTAWELEKVRSNVTLSMLTLAVISVVASLGVFGKDRLVFWRESSSGDDCREVVSTGRGAVDVAHPRTRAAHSPNGVRMCE